MEDYQQRVVDEAKDLEERIEKLTAFHTSEKYENADREQRVLLGRQLAVMREYHDILTRRIALFPKS
jgi:hypothetical protein